MDPDKPVKSILKKSSSSNLRKERRISDEDSQKKSQSWDEMNIIATYKPEGKDYGHMPINEAKTPYRYNIDDEAGSSSSPVFSMDELASRMNTLDTRHAKVHIPNAKMRDSDEDEPPFVDLEKVRQFELRRKQIYNEGLNIKRARELIAREELDDQDESDSDPDDDYKYLGLDQYQTVSGQSTSKIPAQRRGGSNC